VLGWTAALVLPNLVLAAWWFRGAAPLDVLKTLYSSDQPLVLRAPLAFACIALLLALFSQNRTPHSTLLTGRSRGRIATATLLGLLLVTAFVFGTPFLLSLWPAMTGGLIVLSATAFGLRLCECPPLSLLRERFSSPLERLVISTALGLGALAVLVFILGSLGLLLPAFWWLLIVALSLQGASLLRGLLRDLQASAKAFTASGQPVAVAAAAFTFAWCATHLFLLWSPPLDYDVLEYHLAAPAQYLRAGRITFLHENIYATFWQNAEMLYLVALTISGEKRVAIAGAHVILFAAWVLSVCGVYALARRLLTRKVGDFETPGPAIAALLYALIPLGSHLVSDFYVEHVQALFHLCAVLAACAFLQEQRQNNRLRSGWLILAGLLAGFCCGTKYTALLFTLAPLLLLVPLTCALRGAAYEALSAAATIGVAALAVICPWALRNAIASGDPMHPLGLVMKRRAGAPLPQPDHLDHFDIATRAGERSLNALIQVLYQLVPGLKPREPGSSELGAAFGWLHQSECGPHLLCFAVPGVLSAFRGAGFLIAFFLLDVALWFVFTYRLNRFMYPLLGPLAAIAAIGIAQLWCLQPLRKVIAAIALGSVLAIAPLSILYVYSLSRPARGIGAEEAQTAAREQYTAFGNKNWFDAWSALNALPADSNVLFIGDAQTFYLDKTPHYSVVFNPHLLEEILRQSSDGRTAAALLAARGITHLYINTPEWLRLDTSYSLMPAGDGGLQLAQLDRTQRDTLRRLLAAKQYALYGRAWPVGVHPAYLKIRPRDYAALDDLLNRHSVTQAQFPDPAGRPTCELRQLIFSTGDSGTALPAVPK